MVFDFGNHFAKYRSMRMKIFNLVKEAYNAKEDFICG